MQASRNKLFRCNCRPLSYCAPGNNINNMMRAVLLADAYFTDEAHYDICRWDMRESISLWVMYLSPVLFSPTNFWLYLGVVASMKQVLWCLMYPGAHTWGSPAAVGGKQLQYGCSSPLWMPAPQPEGCVKHQGNLLSHAQEQLKG